MKCSNCKEDILGNCYMEYKIIYGLSTQKVNCYCKKCYLELKTSNRKFVLINIKGVNHANIKTQ